MSRQIHFEYHRPGKETVVYREALVLDRPDVKVLLQEHFSGDNVLVADTLTLERAAPIVWFIITDSWHDIGRFHLADGTFTGWYTNLSKPVEFNGDHWIGKRVSNERILIDLQLRQNAWPPPIARDMDLRQVRDLLAT